MQIKADFTREDLMGHNDVLFEACHPLERLKAIANLLHGYPQSPFGMDESTITGVANMIEDAAREIEYLINISNEQEKQRYEQNKLKEGQILQASKS